MTVFMVDGPDGVGKTGYSKLISRDTGYPRLEMRPVEDTDCIEAKSAVFNATIRDLHDQDVDLVIDRGSVSSIVYSSIFDRGKPDHAWKTLDHVEPVIVYLRCDAVELVARYDDELFDSDELSALAEEYDEAMDRVAQQTPAQVHTIDTTAGVIPRLDEVLDDVR